MGVPRSEARKGVVGNGEKKLGAPICSRADLRLIGNIHSLTMAINVLVV